MQFHHLLESLLSAVQDTLACILKTALKVIRGQLMKFHKELDESSCILNSTESLTLSYTTDSHPPSLLVSLLKPHYRCGESSAVGGGEIKPAKKDNLKEEERTDGLPRGYFHLS